MKNFVCSIGIVLLITQPSFGGPGDSGGGNVCSINGQVRILELAELQSHFPSQPGVRISDSKVIQYLGIDDLNLLDNGILKRSIESKLVKWEPVHPLLVAELRKSLSKIHFYATSFVPKRSVKADFSESKLCRSNNTRASIVYHNMAAVVSLPLFNAMDLENQTALALHEAGRFLQLEYDSEEYKPSDKDLQELVRILVRDSANHPIYSSSFLRKHPLFKWAEQFSNFCHAFETWEDLNSQDPAKVSQQRENCRSGYNQMEQAVASDRTLTNEENEKKILGLNLFSDNSICNINTNSQRNDPDYQENLDHAFKCLNRGEMNLLGLLYGPEVLAARVSKSIVELTSLELNFGYDLNSLFGFKQIHKRFDEPHLYNSNEIKEIDEMAAQYKPRVKRSIENLELLKK